MAIFFRIFETNQYLKQLKNVQPANLRNQLTGKLRAYVHPQLKQQPFYGPNIKKMRKMTPETWRYRLGRWRLFYSVNDELHTVFLLTITPRKDAY